ncbi:MAG: hypothetical protein EXS10_02270 [Phycisphaerales bacterium]|nr:hypothetical protein [Phycisphaerales bacterium]
MLAAPARGDELADWLEAHNLDGLLATRLELLTKDTTGEELKRVRERLSSTYARLLDLSARGAERETLVVRAGAALGENDGDAARWLDLAIARAHYRTAAEIAEDMRAAVRGKADATSIALAELALALPVLERLQTQSLKSARDLDRRMDSLVGLTQDLARADIQRAEMIATQCRFLRGWAHLYKGQLSDTISDAETAAQIFMEIAGARNGRLEPGEVSLDLRGEEAFASTILGLGLAKAETQGYGEATRWLNLLEVAGAYEGLRTRLDGWRLATAVRAKDWAAARKILKVLATQDGAETAWYRVAAAGGLRAANDDAAALTLAKEALAQLATRRELAQVRDIVEQFNGRGLEGDGFVARYVASLTQYDAARATDDALAAARDRGATVDSAMADNAMRVNREALKVLDAALAAEDAEKYPEARDGCKLMRAYSLRGAREYRAAAAAFDEVATTLTGERGENAAWAAISCLDELSRTMQGAERTALDAQIASLSDAFLRRFPASMRVIELFVRRVQADPLPDIADIEKLLAVPSTEPTFEASRRAALGGLYRSFRAATIAADRTALGRRYIGVLPTLPEKAGAEALPGGSVGIARQALEVALAHEVTDTALAAHLLGAIDAAVLAGAFELSEAREELAYRRLQLAIMQNQWELVESGLAQFELPNATAIWADASLRLALRGAEIARRATAKDDPRRSAFVGTSVRAADALIARAGGLDAAAKSPASIGFLRTLLDARKEMVTSSASPEDAKAGLVVAQALIAAGNREAGVLQSAAFFAESSGQYEIAIEQLKGLVAGIPSRTAPWFRAKYDLARVLLLLDADRSLAVLEQHRKLHPDLGPGEWKAKFEALEVEARAKSTATTEGST